MDRRRPTFFLTPELPRRPEPTVRLSWSLIRARPELEPPEPPLPPLAVAVKQVPPGTFRRQRRLSVSSPGC